MRYLGLVGLLALLCACTEPAPPPVETPNTADAFQALLDEHWAEAEKEQIFFRKDPDAWRMNGPMSEHTPEGRARRQAFNDLMLEKLATIDPAMLDAKDRVSYQVFKYERETERDSYAYYDHRFPFTSLFGYHTYFAEAPSNMSFLSAEDYDKYLVSLADFTRYNRERIEELKEGIATGYTHYCESVADYGRTMEEHIVGRPEDSKLFVPFENFPATIGEDQRAAYIEQGSQLIMDVVVPGFQELAEFFELQYLPNCRDEVGITTREGGEDYYNFLIRYFTTTDMTPQEIHELGLAEVERIRGEMQVIIDEVGFEGGFREFLDYLRNEPSFYAKSIDELLGRAALISKTAEGAAPRFFSVLPRGTYKIAENPGRGTFYMPSSGDGTTSGTYFVATASLDAQPFYTLEALSLHEGVPGHHLQSALAMEIGLPEFRRTLYHSAYGEGWGLYSERLGLEMGFYEDPYSNFGRLVYEIWRAVRLVVDTGMHAFGWDRQQAIDYMLENTGLSELEIIRETDRYITWPAQALSYKIGELRIRELRARAEAELGSEFDIREFHDTVVGNGSVPIAVLDDIVNEWIASQNQE